MPAINMHDDHFVASGLHRHLLKTFRQELEVPGLPTTLMIRMQVRSAEKGLCEVLMGASRTGIMQERERRKDMRNGQVLSFPREETASVCTRFRTESVFVREKRVV